MHPSGKFVYATNRGHNSVAVFSVQAEYWAADPIQNISTQGKTPRNCRIRSHWRWLLVSNQDSANAVVFSIDPNTGRLTQTGPPVTVPAPFCERFLRSKSDRALNLSLANSDVRVSRNFAPLTDAFAQKSGSIACANDVMGWPQVRWLNLYFDLFRFQTIRCKIYGKWLIGLEWSSGCELQRLRAISPMEIRAVIPCLSTTAMCCAG